MPAVGVVHPPRHPGVGEHLGHRRPGAGELQGLLGVGDEDGTPGHPGRVRGARHLHQPVGMGRAEDRTEVVVADGEVFGQVVIEGNARAVVVAHGHGAEVRDPRTRRRVGGDEAVHGAGVPGGMFGLPGVVQVVGAFSHSGGGVEMEGQQGRAGSPGPGLGEGGRMASKPLTPPSIPK